MCIIASSVFLHGGAIDNAMLSWKEVIDLMGNQYDIYAIDANKGIKNSRLHIMKGYRHWTQKERPEEFTEILKVFLLNNNL